MSETLTGRCHCGGVSFTITGARRSTCCHCSICRRVTGAPFIEIVGVRGEQSEVTVADGITLNEYATSDYLTRMWCSRCGAGVYNAVQLDGRPEYRNFMIGLVDDRSAIPRSHHIYYADRTADVGDDLPKFDAFGRP